MRLTISDVSQNYSEAFHNHLVKNNSKKYKKIIQEFDRIIEILESNVKLYNFFKNPTIVYIDKKKVTEELCSNNNISDELMNFLLIIVENERSYEIIDIFRSLRDLYEEYTGVIFVKITVPEKITKLEENKIISQIEETLQKSLKYKINIDSNILDGIIIEYDWKIIDNSLENKLKNIKSYINSRS